MLTDEGRWGDVRRGEWEGGGHGVHIAPHVLPGHVQQVALLVRQARDSHQGGHVVAGSGPGTRSYDGVIPAATATAITATAEAALLGDKQ